jgi:hypothetical protein
MQRYCKVVGEIHDCPLPLGALGTVTIHRISGVVMLAGLGCSFGVRRLGFLYNHD